MSHNEEEALKGPRAAAAWKVRLDIMQALIESEACIFGGAVRDWVLHDTHAKAFYDATNADSPEDLQAKYDDPTWLPECSGRTTLPTDIDATLKFPYVSKWFDAMHAKKYHMKRVFIRPAKTYLPDLTAEAGDFMHHRYEVFVVQDDAHLRLGGVIMAQLPQPLGALWSQHPQGVWSDLLNALKQLTCVAPAPVTVDLMVQIRETTIPWHRRRWLPPFGALDFECNALLWDKTGLRVTPELLGVHEQTPVNHAKTLARVMGDIEQRRAVWCGSDAQNFRIHHMKRKGWRIEGFHTIQHAQEAAYDGHCLLCHETFETNESHYKMTCCDARYHGRCFMAAVSGYMAFEGRCTMCKRHRDTSDLRNDLRRRLNKRARINSLCKIDRPI